MAKWARSEARNDSTGRTRRDYSGHECLRGRLQKGLWGEGQGKGRFGRKSRVGLQVVNAYLNLCAGMKERKGGWEIHCFLPDQQVFKSIAGFGVCCYGSTVMAMAGSLHLIDLCFLGVFSIFYVLTLFFFLEVLLSFGFIAAVHKIPIS